MPSSYLGCSNSPLHSIDFVWTTRPQQAGDGDAQELPDNVQGVALSQYALYIVYYYILYYSCTSCTSCTSKAYCAHPSPPYPVACSDESLEKVYKSQEVYERCVASGSRCG